MEELAIRFMTLGDVWAKTVAILLAASGFIMALAVHRNRRWSIRRVPYFILVTMTMLVSSCASFAWLLTYEALTARMLWLLTLLVFLMQVSVGYVLGMLAHARAISGYGTGKAAWLGMIPLLNLMLLLVEPLETQKSRWSGPVVNFFGTLLGIALFFSSGVAGAVSAIEVEDLARRAARDPALKALRLKIAIASEGLEAVMLKDASNAKPQRLNDEFTLKKVQATGTNVRYVYELAGNLNILSEAFRNEITQSNCATLRSYFEAGATIEHQFLRRDGTQAELFTIPPSACGY
ncbi:hypothetical protein [Rhizobium sp.]